jgi:hypothetical protein
MTKTPALAVSVLVFVVASILSLPDSTVSAEGESSAVKTVIYLIEASDGPGGIDPAIKDIVKQVSGTLRYSSYKVFSTIRKKIDIGDDEDISLPGSRELNIRALGYEEDRIKLRVKIAEKSGRGESRDMVNTEIRIVKGGTFIIGGYDHDGGKLIVAISADM